MQIRLDGRVAVVTGGSKGIGKAIAAGLMGAGANVVISSRKADGLAAAVEELTANAPQGAGSVSWFAANAGDPAQAAACMAEVMARHGRVDILVNNAAVNPYFGPMLEIDVVRAEKTVAVNQLGYIVWTKLAWDAWMQANGGAVLNLSSVGGLSVEEGIGYYNVTKAAVLHMTRQLAAEMAPGVRVNAIAPGLVKTDFAKALWEVNETKLAARTPLQRLGEPVDIANAAVFLCSDAASWITGTHLVIDGGSLTGPSLS